MSNNTIETPRLDNPSALNKTPRLGTAAAKPKTKRFGGLGLMLENGLGNVTIEESDDYSMLIEYPVE